MRNILLIRFSSLGDVVLTSAVIEALHTLGGNRITLLTRAAYAPLFASDPRIARLVGIEGGERPSEIAALCGTTFDAVADLHGTLRSIPVSALIRAPMKLRIHKRSLARRFMIWSGNRFRRTFDVLGSSLETVRPLGVTERVLPRIVPGERELREAESLLSGIAAPGGRRIGLAPGSRHREKRWGAESYAMLADSLIGRGDIPVFIGDANDRECIRDIAARMKGSAPSLAGAADLGVTAGIISLLDGLVSNDSGPMHLAGALGTPCAAVFGPTHPDLGFVPGYPRMAVLHTGLSCSPCSVHGQTPCRLGTRVCMTGIAHGAVLRELDRLMDK